MEYPIQPRPNDQEVVAAPSEGEAAFCQYCGSPLSHFFYFCLACGTPYKSISTVITPHRPRILTDGELIERKVPHLWTLFWSYFGTLVVSMIVMAIAFREERPDLQLLISHTMLLVLTCIWGIIHRAALKAQFSVFGFNRAAAYVGLAALVPLLAINFGYSTFLQSLLPEKAEGLTDELREVGVSDAVLVLAYCVLPGVLEEIAFRGLVQHWLQTAIRPRNAIIFASFLFTVLHFSILSFPYLFLVGALLGWVKWKTGSLYPSILIHFLHNYVVIEYFEKWH